MRVRASPSSVQPPAADQAHYHPAQAGCEKAQADDAHHKVHDCHVLVVAKWGVTLHIEGLHLLPRMRH